MNVSILVIDDEAPIRRMLTACLSDLGYRVVTVATAAEGSALLQQSSFRLVILDLLLPDTVGFEFVVSLKRDYPQLPLLILTGMDYEEDILRASLNAGADGFVSKLATLENLITEIHCVLRRTAPASAKNAVKAA